MTYLLQELRETLVDDGLDDAPIDISQPDAHQGSHNKQGCEHIDVAGFFARIRRQHYFHQLLDSDPEELVNVAATTLLSTTSPITAELGSVPSGLLATCCFVENKSQDGGKRDLFYKIIRSACCVRIGVAGGRLKSPKLTFFLGESVSVLSSRTIKPVCYAAF